MPNLQTTDISVVIPVKNESAGLAACLQGILDQTVPVHEIIVIDSGSTDGTQDIARRFDKVRLVEISSTEFNHGDTRNLGLRESNGAFILFTVGDARPCNNLWIDELLKGFTGDDVAVVSGAQVLPRERHANPIDWFRPVSQPQIETFRFGNAEEFSNAPSATKSRACSLDNVTAIYRRSALQEIGFRRLVYGEDVLFAYDAYRAGKAISFNPAARVYHYHIETYQSILKRTVAVASLRYRLFGQASLKPPLLSSVARYVFRLAREKDLTWRQRARWLSYNLRILIALRRGINLVDTAASSGAEALSAVHDKYCGTPPIPLRRT
jgi:rhamnosyltransferase